MSTAVKWRPLGEGHLVLWRLPTQCYLEWRLTREGGETLYQDDAGTEKEMRRRYEEVLVLQTTALDRLAEEALRLDGEATGGPWNAGEGTPPGAREAWDAVHINNPMADAVAYCGIRADDARFIANARTGYPALARAFQILRAATHG